MGRVYSPAEVASGNIPEPGSHELAGRFLLNQFFESQPGWTESEQLRFDIDGNGIQSGLIYGSTAVGTATIRSDLDILLNYHSGKSDKVFPLIRDAFQSVEGTYKVTVEPNILPVGALFNPNGHQIDPLFAEHLFAVQNQDDPRWSYGWPIDGLVSQVVDREDNARIRAITLRYISSKSRQFTKEILGYRGELDLQIFQRALELPGAIGRKAVAATVNSRMYSDTSDRTSIVDVAISLLDKFAPQWLQHAAKSQRDLHNLDKDYDELLTGAIAGSVSLSEYERWLSKYYLWACNLAHDVSRAWYEIIECKMDIPLNGRLPEVPQELDAADFDAY